MLAGILLWTPILALLALVTPTAHAAGVRIMPLGDSITNGANVPGGYRIELWRRLVTEDRLGIDFVGSLQNGSASLGDREHEGHPGWRIDDLAAAVDGWLAQHRPEIILLMIGTNDMAQNQAVATAPARLGALLDRITARLPTATVLVASLPPLGTPEADARVRAYNRAVPGVVQSRAAAGKKVVFVDVARGLTPADLADGIHPTQRGYAAIAEAWSRALRPLLR